MSHGERHKFFPMFGARQAARDKLGFGRDERIVLVVCGSWGIGANLPAVVDALT